MFRCKKCGRTSATMRLHENCPFCEHKDIISTTEVEPHETRYCSHCGIVCIEKMLGAETNMMFYGDQSTIPLDSAYDKKTGQRNYCYKYTCPKWEKKCWGLFYSDHDDYFVDKVIKV